MVKVTPIPALRDNYIWCIHDNNYAVVVDPGEASPVKIFLKENNLKLDTILITHHHADHTGGVWSLKNKHVNVVGPVSDRIRHIKEAKSDGEKVYIPSLGISFEVMDVPAHTKDHIAYFGDTGLFCGDTMFSVGCGRLFEGTPEQMLTAFERFKALPQDTQVYCTHEYTQANLDFALDLTPEHQELREYQQWVSETRAAGLPTLPSNIGLETRVNPYMRVGDSDIQSAVLAKTGVKPTNNIETFASVRTLKDNF